MANTSNIMSIAPNQPASSTRTTSQSTQPKYKSAARQGKKNFGATLDKLNAKIDELKQNIQDLQDSTKKITQSEPDAKDLDAPEEISAQGTSDTPQDAPQEAIGNEELGIRNDSKPIAGREIKPADIFFVADKSADTIEVADAQKPIVDVQPEKLQPSVDVKPVVAEIVKPINVDTSKTQPTEKISTENLRGVDVQDTSETPADKVDDQPQKTFFAANNAAYLFNMNAETLLAPKSADIQPQINVPKVETAQEVLPAQNLMTLMPQNKVDNSQAMLHMLGGRSWRVIQPQVQAQVQVQAQPVEVQPQVQVQPTLQAQPVNIQPQVQAQVQPTLQAQPVNIQPQAQAQVQPSLQPQPIEIQPQVQAQVQPTLQAQPVNIQPQAQAQVQPSLQAQPVNIQPQVQAQVQPSLQAQPINFEPQVQAQVQPTLQPQPINFEPQVQAQVQPTLQAQLVNIQPQVQVQVQPTLQAQPINFEPQVQAQVQPTLQAQPVNIQPQVQAQVQPTLQAQLVNIQPQAQVQVQPTLQPQPVEIQPQAQVQVQPTLQAQPVNIQPQVQAQVQPTLQAQPINFEPQVQAQVQPTLQAQPVNIQPQVQAQVQPTLQPQPVEIQPQVQAQVQPTLQAQPVNIQPQVQAQVQPTLQAQSVEFQAEIQVAQPVVQQKLDAQPTIQNLSELLGVNVQVEDAPIAAPVSAPQAPPQQFNQDTQQGAQNFQQQIFQPATTDEPQPQQVSTGGEIFAANLNARVDSPQPQPSTPLQAPDAPPPTQDQFDIQGQIVRQARLIRTTENTQMVIKLNPEHLGELTLRISVSQNGAVNASFHSDNAQVRTVIENSLVQLRQELNNQGLKVENVQVYAGLSDGGLMNGQGGQAWQQNRQQRQGNRRIDFDALENDIDSTAPVNESSSADGVDYSV